LFNGHWPEKHRWFRLGKSLDEANAGEDKPSRLKAKYIIKQAVG